VVGSRYVRIACTGSRLLYDDACRIAEEAAAEDHGAAICIGLEHVTEASLAAFAKLILLRRELIDSGRDLWIVGLRGQAEAIYETNRLTRLLPREPASPQAVAGRERGGRCRDEFSGSGRCRWEGGGHEGGTKRDDRRRRAVGRRR
jgi:hypothetical protein